MTNIGAYTLRGQLTNNKAGNCCWAFCEKDGRDYFIKQFMEVSYPPDDGKLSPKILSRKRRIAEEFHANKEAFYRELAKCRTGNNVVIVDFFLSGSRYYAVSDRIFSAGTDPGLIACLSREKKEVLLRALFYSVARFHEKGIIHCDLKPDNILLKKTEGGFYTAKIIDFDGGFLRSSPRAEGEINFDYVYAAPEIIQMNLVGRETEETIELTEKADIFALGILMHEYWTGKRPEIDKEYNNIAAMVLDRQGSRIKYDPSVPAEYISVIRRMLARDPKYRPSAEEVLQSLWPKEMPSDDPWYIPTEFD